LVDRIRRICWCHMDAIPHILYIDDDEHDRFLFSRSFFISGIHGALHCLSSASNGLLYLQQKGPFASSPRPRLIIVDLQLPRSDGQQFHEILQTDPRWSDIALIVLAGTQTNADIDSCYPLAVNMVRPKPQSDIETIELLRSLSREYLVAQPSSLQNSP